MKAKFALYLKAILAWIVIAAPMVSQAHPGHNLADHGLSHVLTSPYHLAVLAVAGGGLWAAAACVQKRWLNRSLRTAGVLALVSALLLAVVY